MRSCGRATTLKTLLSKQHHCGKMAAEFSVPQITILKRTRGDLDFAQKKFLKKTKKGRVVKILRERYLRSDIPCGYEACTECSDYPGFKQVLPVQGAQGHSKFKSEAGHWLVVDTNIVLHQVSCYCHDSLVGLNPSTVFCDRSMCLKHFQRLYPSFFRRRHSLKPDTGRFHCTIASRPC